MSSKNSSKKKRRLALRQVLIATATLLAVLVVIIFSSRAHPETVKIATDQFNKQQLILARCSAAGIESYFKEIKAALSSLAKLPDVQKMTPGCFQYLKYIYHGFPTRTSIRLLDSDGILRYIYPPDDWRNRLIGRDYSEETFFRETRKSGHPVVSRLTTNEQNKLRIRIAVPVYGTHNTEFMGVENGVFVTTVNSVKPETGEFQGILIGSFDPKIITETFISPIVSGKTGYAWLLNGEGVFLAHYENEFSGRNAFESRINKNPDIDYSAIEQIQRKMIAGEEGTGRYTSGWHKGRKCEIEKLVAYSPVRVNDQAWSVAVSAPISEVEEIVRVTEISKMQTLGLVILLLIAGGVALFVTSYCWTHSLEREVAGRTMELRETSDYLTNLIRHANAPIIVWDPDKQVTIFNKAFERMSGRSEAEMKGQPLDLLFPEESRSVSIRKIESTAKGEYWKTVEIPILHLNGETRIGLWNSANIYAEDGTTLIATVAQGHDITEHKRAEEALQESEKQLREAQKMEAVGQLAGGVAHDFNNMLTAIQGYAQLALTTLPENDPIRNNISEIQHSAERAANLTRQLLLFGRKQHMDKRPLDQNALIKDLTKMLYRLIEEDISLQTRLADGLWTVNADPGNIEQVIMNLIVNARDAMPDGGEILIETSNVYVDEERCKTHAEARPGKMVLLSVKDTGIGMNEDTLRHIFEPFFTTKVLGVGTGLGLSVVYGIVKQHNGWLEVESVSGHETTFKVYLPAIASEPEERHKDVVSPETLTGNGERILLVEDEEPVRNFTVSALSTYGYSVSAAKNVGEAMNIFEREDGRFDLVFSDVVLPDGKGPQLVDRLIGIKPGIRIILTSGYCVDGSVWEDIQSGGHPYIQKPYSLSVLLTAVRDVLNK